ncbi:MAG: thioredoxin family protein [Bacteroidales bacterium]|nr:thioredoxin family protein [Bacteroidales bacterium]
MTFTEFEILLSSHPSFMLYFYNDTCGVCKTLRPQVEALVKEEFPEIRLIRVNATESRELAGQLRMLSVPGIVLFMEGQEIFRANGMISMNELHNRIARPYGMMFE